MITNWRFTHDHSTRRQVDELCRRRVHSRADVRTCDIVRWSPEPRRRAIVLSMAETADWAQYRWRKVYAVHGEDTGRADCAGELRSYTYRYYKPESAMYERCVGLAWCSQCRHWQGNMVHVPRAVELADPLAEISVDEREKLLRSEYKLVRHLDRIDRRNTKS